MLPLLLSLVLAVPSLGDTPYAARGPLNERGGGFLHARVAAHVGSRAFRVPNRKRQVVSNLTALPDTSYTIDLEIGTPPQKIPVVIDTGSSDLWVNPTCATSGAVDSCTNSTQFDYTKSSTLEDLGYENHLYYLKGDVLVEYVADTVTIGSTPVKNQIFGLGIQSNDLSIGFMGLSPPAYTNGLYPYVLDNLAMQKLIASRAFSLDLRAPGDSSGAIIFGGVDTGKFIGALQKCPILPISQTPDGRQGYWISLTGIGITTPDGVSHTSPIAAVPVTLDSGTTAILLPNPVFLALGELFPGASYDPISKLFMVDCAVVSPIGTIDFTFGGKVISVGYSDLIFQVGNQCLLVVGSTDNQIGLAILGGPFLRAAYTVFDEDNGNLHLAQAANCGNNVIVIGSGPDAVPSSIGMCTVAASAVPTVSATVGLNVSTTVSPTALYSGSPFPTSELLEPGPQVSVTSVPGSTKPTVCTTCGAAETGGVTGTGVATKGSTGTGSSPTSTSSGGAESVRVEFGAIAAVVMAIFGALGL